MSEFILKEAEVSGEEEDSNNLEVDINEANDYIGDKPVEDEKELKFVTVSENYFQYIDRDYYRCFLDQCDEVLRKEKKQQFLPSV